jgi:hypothetical protein
MHAALTIHNKTDDTFTFKEAVNSFIDPPQEIAPDEKIELFYNPGTPTMRYYWNSNGQLVVEVGKDDPEDNKVFTEGAYSLESTAWAWSEVVIVKR